MRGRKSRETYDRRPATARGTVPVESLPYWYSTVHCFAVDHAPLRANDKQRWRLITTTAWQKQRNRPGSQPGLDDSGTQSLSPLDQFGQPGLVRWGGWRIPLQIPSDRGNRPCISLGGRLPTGTPSARAIIMGTDKCSPFIRPADRHPRKKARNGPVGRLPAREMASPFSLLPNGPRPSKSFPATTSADGTYEACEGKTCEPACCTYLGHGRLRRAASPRGQAAYDTKESPFVPRRAHSG